MTALATLAMTSAAKWGDASAAQTRDNGVRWLSQTKSDNDPQSIALRLVLWQRAGRTPDELAPLSLQIQQRQNDDGGWSQSHEMSSDAWATGQALYALAHAGLTASSPVISRGHDFLVKTQREDGSWPMTSRPIKPGGPGSTSLIPIIGAGSAWAVMGLVCSQ